MKLYVPMFLACLTAAILTPGCGESTRGPGASPAATIDLSAAAGAVTPSLVRVEYSLKYDKGEPPRAGGWVHVGMNERGREGFDAEASVLEERPMEVAGFLVGPTRVVTADPMIHPRFVQGVAVRFGDDVVKAKTVAYAANQAAVFLELERPLKSAKPLVFDAARKGPYFAVSYFFDGIAWCVTVDGMPSGVLVEQPDRRRHATILDALIVDKAGTPVGLTMAEDVPADGSWKGAPTAWPVKSAAELEKMLADTQQRTEVGLLRVTLHFRSPPKDSSRSSMYRGEGTSVTEEHTTGVLVGDNRILILSYLKPKITARLDGITVFPIKGDPVQAKFAYSLKDYGALVATLEKPLPGAIPFSTLPLIESRNELLPAAEITIRGEDRTIYYQHRRIEGFTMGWRKQIFPLIPGEDSGRFVFDPQGALVTLPVTHREKISSGDRDYGRQSGLLPVAYMKSVLENLVANSDPSNVPVTEEEESRLAWLGVELQPLGPELARLNKVAELTQDGETGGMVSYVYPNSPAAKAGIQPGYILLRLRVEGEPKPLEIMSQDMGDREFPWERLDEVPEQYYDRIPTPWPSAESAFVRSLTDLGFGKKYTADFFHDGKLVAKDFEVVQSPPTYDSAPRFKSTVLGLTVRDLTFEVRRCLQKKDTDPGVVVSKIEPGGKVSVAGIKPFELITHVDEKPVMNSKEFEAAVKAAKGEIRLSVKRMNNGRVVKIKLGEEGVDEPKPAAEKPAAEKPAAGAEKPAAKAAPATNLRDDNPGLTP
jgi:serine protease Do